VGARFLPLPVTARSDFLSVSATRWIIMIIVRVDTLTCPLVLPLGA